jgi:Tfp pilus assembly protein PilF
VSWRGLASIVALVIAIESPPVMAQRDDRPPTLAELERRATVDSNDAAMHVQLGRALLESRRYDEAERHFRLAILIAPGRAEAYLGLAAVPSARGEEYWKRREKQDGRSSVASVWLEADKFHRLAFLLDPLVDPGLLPRIEERVTLRVDGVNYRVWWMLPLTKAMNAFRAGKYEEAKRRCAKLVEESHQGPEGNAFPNQVLWVHALSAAHLDDFNVAATDFTVLMNRATRQAQSSPVETMPLLTNDFRYMAAMMHSFTGQREVASLLLREALTVDPSLYMAHTQLAAMLEQTGAWDEAVLERQRAVDANPENGELLIDLGLTLARAGRMEPALAAFDQGGELNPRDPRAPYHAGVTAMQLGRNDVARRLLERFLAIAPSRMAPEMAQARLHVTTLGQ